MIMLQQEFRERITTLSFGKLIENDQKHLTDLQNKLNYEIKSELMDVLIRKFQPVISQKLNQPISENETKLILKEYLKGTNCQLFDS